MSSDDLLRSFVEQHKGEAHQVASLVTKSESDLYALLASRVSTPAAGIGDPDDRFRTESDPDDLERGAAVELGKRIFFRCSQAAHDFCCSPGDQDRKLRDEMLSAIFSKEGGGIALLAGALVTAFGLSPAVAAVVAALLVKIIVAPTIAEVCSAWGNALKAKP
ncbi:hypothetical protein [Bradyrhizobium sp. NAS96.2]|uniref:hypothetical protein n=1 Tax=Bradyrhizobium sp. NAS96.2 TaxID=1680160 RepID=UPI00093E23F3|nr:hypothetical protein [Bradyrhizobium sp. NAS96.2]OKO83554.1 hypothetical protein AC628_01710 [Bradyrhizobium sp. NAS96.2]